jgi:hypothetical protein
MKGCIFGLAKPAPLILANGTCHVVASIAFLTRDFTNFALLHFNHLSPLEEVFIHYIFAFFRWVVFLITLSTKCGFAFFTNSFFIFGCF